ncbi:MAG TPA: fumarylacetoacetate hydrolase family protein [Solirubrobacterales bacterium]|jgi:2-keto-4-pentenoate hydratase/2-oxohepta-3-ene-1,7-dioic acid hydratase in catechol pathway|nr:fumarylacetoacetate hydrolase family protein [Solirubrobacterales bacterium]
MRACTLATAAGAPGLGIVEGDEIVDLSAVGLPAEPAAALAEAGRDGIERLAAGAPRLPLAEIQLLAPAAPRKYLGIALNYADHIAEMGMEAPEVPVFFNKQATCVVGPGVDVHMPKVSTLLDYEAELAIVIGKRCRHVPVERAGEAIAGYTCANDLSVRDWQGRAQTMTIGKSFDTHGPLGPWLVTPDEVGDPQDLRIRCFVDGELRQDASTAEMVFDCFQQVSHLSEAFTLEPGDVIATGTPAGVGIGRQPIRENVLHVGETVRVEIERVGELINTVVEEPDGFVVGG